MNPEPESLVRRVWITVGIVAFACLVVFLLWTASDVLLLTFSAVLLAAFLQGLGSWLSQHTPLSFTWATLLAVLVLLAMVATGVWLLSPGVAAQVDELSQKLTQSFGNLHERLGGYQWVQRFMDQAPSVSQLVRRANVFTQITGVFSSALGLVANAVVVLFLALYLAFSPGVYVGGLVKLFPQGRRERVRGVCGEVGDTLFRWTVGRLLLMVINGGLTALGLWLLDVPLAWTLGILTGVLNFVPNVGPIIAGVPAVLIALTMGSSTALWTVGLFLLVQNLDGYVFTPIVQQRTVSLAPGLTILAQVLFGVLGGSFGLLLATPLTAVGVILVKRFYVEDALGDRS